jgi:hypothetical protein
MHGVCMYTRDDCYPVWKAQKVDQVESEKSSEAVMPSVEVKSGRRTDVTDDGLPTIGVEMVHGRVSTCW